MLRLRLTGIKAAVITRSVDPGSMIMTALAGVIMLD